MKIEVSIGEAIDKLSILELKLKKINNEDKKKEIEKEIKVLDECYTYIKKYEICPPHGNPFMGTPYFTNTANNNTLVNLGIDVLIRFNVQIIENLVKSAIDIDNKTLGSFYVLTALTLVSEPARNAMPWLYEAGVYGGHDGV